MKNYLNGRAWIWMMMLVLSSCGSLEVQKRYHQGGFHISFGKAENNSLYAKRQQHILPKRVALKHSEPKSEVETAKPVKTDERKMEESAEFQFETKSESADAKPKDVVVSKKYPGHQKQSIFIHNQLKYNRIKHNQVNKDVPENSIVFVIYFLLCLVLPPLAYYLIKEDTDTMFWVCLLCYLFAFSWLAGFQFGLFGFISVVIAILSLLNKI
jgi:hypothetical protein